MKGWTAANNEYRAEIRFDIRPLFSAHTVDFILSPSVEII